MIRLCREWSSGHKFIYGKGAISLKEKLSKSLNLGHDTHIPNDLVGQMKSVTPGDKAQSSANHEHGSAVGQ